MAKAKKGGNQVLYIGLAAIAFALILIATVPLAEASNWDRLDPQKNTFAKSSSGFQSSNDSHPYDWIKRLAQNSQKICGLSFC
jgi:hypothetical protein